MGNFECSGNENSISSCNYDQLEIGQCTSGRIATAHCVQGYNHIVYRHNVVYYL